MADQDKPEGQMPDVGHDDPNNWKWGVFYFNKRDKRLFPPKRISGLGWTINFANPLSVLFWVVFFLIILALIKYMRGAN